MLNFRVRENLEAASLDWFTDDLGVVYLAQGTSATDVCGRYVTTCKWNLQTTPAVTAQNTNFPDRFPGRKWGNMTIGRKKPMRLKLLAEPNYQHGDRSEGIHRLPQRKPSRKTEVGRTNRPVGPVAENGTPIQCLPNTGIPALQALAATGAVVTDTFRSSLSNLAVNYNERYWIQIIPTMPILWLYGKTVTMATFCRMPTGVENWAPGAHYQTGNNQVFGLPQQFGGTLFVYMAALSEQKLGCR